MNDGELPLTSSHLGKSKNFSIFFLLIPPPQRRRLGRSIHSSTEAEAQQFFLIKLNGFLNSLMRLPRIFWLNRNDDDAYLCSQGELNSRFTLVVSQRRKEKKCNFVPVGSSSVADQRSSLSDFLIKTLCVPVHKQLDCPIVQLCGTVRCWGQQTIWAPIEFGELLMSPNSSGVGRLRSTASTCEIIFFALFFHKHALSDNSLSQRLNERIKGQTHDESSTNKA